MGAGITGGFGELDALIESFNPGTLKTAIVERATAKIADRARAQYASGQGPDGEAWPLTKDGQIALQGPTSEIVFRAENEAVTGTGPDVLGYHAKTRPVFPPAGELSPAWMEAADEGVAEVMAERFGGT
ncbi:MAG: hypothetical protein U0441_14885 [Polyangiaceae bacterium]